MRGRGSSVSSDNWPTAPLPNVMQKRRYVLVNIGAYDHKTSTALCNASPVCGLMC